MNKLKSLMINLLGKLISSLQRFPETIAVSVTMVILGIILNHSDTDAQETLGRILMSIALGLPATAALKLFTERKSITLIIRIIIDALIGLAVLGYYLIMPEELSQQFMIRYVSISMILYLIFIWIPYYYKRKLFSIYCMKLATSFLITYLYTLVLYLGMISIIFTVDKLFNLNIDGEIYGDLLMISVGIFGITYFLGSIPLFKTELSISEYPKVLKVLFTAIVMPLLVAYSVVLYAYFTKILINFEWPEGLVGQMVLWFGLVSVFILFAISDLEEKSGWIKIYKRFFPIILFIPLGMMTTAIGIRVREYGWTFPRYYVAIAGIWILILTVYYLLRKREQSTFVVPSLIILILISIYGPLNSFNVSINSQSKRLEALLVENDMLENGEIQPRTDLSEEVQGEISSIVSYLDSVEAKDKVAYLPEDFTFEKMKTVFGFEYSYYAGELGSDYLNYYVDRNNSITSTTDYEYIIDFMANRYDQEGSINNDRVSFVISIEEDFIEVKLDDVVLINESVKNIVDDLHANVGNKNKSDLINSEEMTYTLENDKIKVVFEFVNINGEIRDENEIYLNSLDGRAWIHLK